MDLSSFSNLLSPMGGEYCDYFYLISLLNLVLLFYVVFMGLYELLFSKKKSEIRPVVMSSLTLLLGYFTNRLLYSMCVGSTQQ